MTIPSLRSLIFEVKSKWKLRRRGRLRKTSDFFRNLRKWSCRLQKSQNSQDKNLTLISQKKLAGILNKQCYTCYWSSILYPNVYQNHFNSFLTQTLLSNLHCRTWLVPLLRATRGAHNPNLQVVIMHASHVCSQCSFGLPLRMNWTNKMQFDHVCFDFLPSLSDQLCFDHLSCETYAKHSAGAKVFGPSIVLARTQ